MKSQGEDVDEVAQTATSTEETDTSDVSSNVKETAQGSKESASAGDTEDTEKSVPYSRFREVNEKASRVEELERQVAELKQQRTAPAEVNPQKEQIKEALKPILDELGYVSKEALERDKEDEYVKGEIARLEQKYDGKDGRPKFDRNTVVRFAMDKKIGDIETAYEKLHQAEIINWHVKEAIAKSKGLKTESSDGSGSSESGTTNDDLKEAIAKGDHNALHTFLKRVTKPTQK